MSNTNSRKSAPFHSNCVIEGLKVKLRHPGKVHLHLILPSHIMWDDGEHSYHFVGTGGLSSYKDFKLYDYLYYEGCVETHNLSYIEKYRRFSKKYHSAARKQRRKERIARYRETTKSERRFKNFVAMQKELFRRQINYENFCEALRAQMFPCETLASTLVDSFEQSFAGIYPVLQQGLEMDSFDNPIIDDTFEDGTDNPVAFV